MDPKHTHTMDQVRAALVDHAATLWAYFDHLVAMGFTRAEALRIVVSYQETVLGSVTRRPES
jgi:hypothetical protein